MPRNPLVYFGAVLLIGGTLLAAATDATAPAALLGIVGLALIVYGFGRQP